MGTNKYVIDSNQNNTEIHADPHEDQVPQTSIKVDAARSKAKVKPQHREHVDTPTIIPMHERRWIDIEPSEPTLASNDLLEESYQSSSTQSNFIFEIIPHKYSICLMIVGKHAWEQGRGAKRGYQYCSDDSGRILYLRALQGHSGSNLIHPVLKDIVVIGSGIFHHIYLIGCAFNLHSMINNGLIPGGQDLSRRQTVFFLPIDQETKIINILNILTSQYQERNTCTMHGRSIKTRYSGLVLLLRSKRINILSNTIECNYPAKNTSGLLHSQTCEIEDWTSLV